MTSIIAGGINNKRSTRSQDTLLSPNGLEALLDIIYVDVLSPGPLALPGAL